MVKTEKPLVQHKYIPDLDMEKAFGVIRQIVAQLETDLKEKNAQIKTLRVSNARILRKPNLTVSESVSLQDVKQAWYTVRNDGLTEYGGTNYQQIVNDFDGWMRDVGLTIE